MKASDLLVTIEKFFGVDYFNESENVFSNFLRKETLQKNFGSVANFISKTLSMTLMTAFFVVLWLAESINFEKLLNNTILKQKYASVKNLHEN